MTQQKTYNNPIPVAVALIPVRVDDDIKLLGVVRAKDDGVGELALPGGYLEGLDYVELAASKEVSQEVGEDIAIPPEDWQLFMSRTAPNGRLLVFALLNRVLEGDVLQDRLPACDEVSGYGYISVDTPLAFDLHEQAVKKFYEALAAYRAVQTA